MAIKTFDILLAKHARDVDLLLKQAVEHQIGEPSHLFKEEYKDNLSMFRKTLGNYQHFIDKELESLGD